ncbi:MAG: PF20097 family protein [Faecousia sp.]
MPYMLKRVCPRCGGVLEEGTFRSRGGNYFLPMNQTSPLLYAKPFMDKNNAIPLPPNPLPLFPQWPLAYACRNCKLIVIPCE